MTTDHQEREFSERRAVARRREPGWAESLVDRRKRIGTPHVTLYRSYPASTLRDQLPAIARTFGISIVDASIAAEHHLIRGDE